MEYYGFIYITTNLVNGNRYMGKKSIDKRGVWKTYLGSGILLQRAINKYGKKNFQREIIEYCFTLDELNNREKYWINYYNAVLDRTFYNCASGGDGGNTMINYNDEQKNSIV